MTTLDMTVSPALERAAESDRTEALVRRMQRDNNEALSLGRQAGALDMRLKIVRRLIAEGCPDLAIIVGRMEPDAPRVPTVKERAL